MNNQQQSEAPPADRLAILLRPIACVRQHLQHTVHSVTTIAGKMPTRFILGGIGVALLLLMLWPPLTLPLDRALSDRFQALAAQVRTPDPDIVVAAIDTETLQAARSRWPWKRTEMAQALRAVAAGRPKAIVLDIVFQKEDEGDDALVEAIREAGNVYLVNILEEKQSDRARALQGYHSHARLRKAAAGEGFVWLVVDEDQVLREFVLYDPRMDRNSCVLQTALSTARVATTTASALARQGTGLTSFVRRGSIPTFSVGDLVRGVVGPESLKDRIVFLGVTAQIAHDVHHTPLGLMPGVFLLANTFDAIISGRVARRLDTWWIRLVLGLAGLAASLLTMLAGRRGGPVRSLILLGAFLILSQMGSQVSGYHLPWAVAVGTWLFATLLLHGLNTFSTLLENHRLKSEAAAAAKVQKQFFPGTPWISPLGYSCRGLCVPYDAVGGDFFDIIPQADGSVACIVIDVTGHGVPAAMMTTLAKSFSVLFSDSGRLRVEEYLTAMNRVLFTMMRRTKFMVTTVGLLNIEQHSLRIFFSGPPPVYQIPACGPVIEHAEANHPIGTRGQLTIKSREISIQPGDRILFLTDGLIEATNPRNEPMDFSGFVALLERFRGEKDDDRFLHLVLQGVRDHCQGKPFDDDVTMVLLSRTSVQATGGQF